MQRINTLLAHAWMVRNFLKHADEVQDDEELLEVPRTIFDYIRAVEPSYQAGNTEEYIRRARGKLSKLRRVEQLFAREFRRVSDHTNFQMAAASLTACVNEIEAALSAAASTPGPHKSAPTLASEPPATPPAADPRPTPPLSPP